MRIPNGDSVSSQALPKVVSHVKGRSTPPNFTIENHIRNGYRIKVIDCRQHHGNVSVKFKITKLEKINKL